MNPMNHSVSNPYIGTQISFYAFERYGVVRRFHRLYMPHASEKQAYQSFLLHRGMNPEAQPQWEDFADMGEFAAADYVAGSLRNIRPRLGGETPIYANVGWEDEWAETAPAPTETQTYHAVRAAIDAGSEGIFLSRGFSADLCLGEGFEPVTPEDASKGGSKIKVDGDVGPRGLAAYGAALRDVGWI